MNSMLKVIFSLSISGSLLILLLFLCKLFYKNKFSKQWQYYIWLIAIARLLLPFTPKVSMVGMLFSQTAQTTQLDIPSANEHHAPPVQPIGNNSPTQNNNSFAAAIKPTQTNIQLILQNLWQIWFWIALILLIRKITIYQGFVNYIKAGRREVSETMLLDQLAQIETQLGLKKPVELYTNPMISSPLLFGFFRPCIVLPTMDLSDSDFQFTLWHELMHYKRFDIFYKWLVQATVCLHWFNPLVYLMRREINRACELSCDETVIQMLGAQERQAYGETLLRAIGIGGAYKNSFTTVALNESAELLKERLGAIMHFKKSSKLVIILSFLFAITLSMGATAFGAYHTSSGKTERTASKQNTDGSTLLSLAEQCYQNRSIAQFSILYKYLDEESQNYFLEKSYADSNIAFFSVCINQLELDKDTLETWLAKSIQDKQTSFQAALLNTIGNGQELDLFEGTLELHQLEEYQAYGITEIDNIYYYQNQPVNIFMDLRADSSFVVLNINPKGIVNLRITRDENDQIKSIDYMTDAEVVGLLGDMEDPDDTHSKIKYNNADMDIFRLNKEDVSDQIQNAIITCTTRIWYVLEDGQFQYIYFGGLPYNYAFQPELGTDAISEETIHVNIYDIPSKLSDKNYVLLAVPKNLEITISYNDQQVSYTKIFL